MSGDSESHGKTGGKFMGWVKRHPYATGGIVFVVGFIILILLSKQSGGASGASTDNSAGLAAQVQSEAIAAQAAAQQQQLSAAAAAQTAQVNGAVSVNQSNNQAAVDIATIQANSANQIASLEAALGTTQSNNQTTTNNLGITTQGNVQLAGIDASTQQAKIASDTQVALGAQETGVLGQLLSGIFAQPQNPAYSGPLPATAGGHSAGVTISNTAKFLSGVPANSLFTPAQINQLLNG